MRFDVVTIFPGYFAPLRESLVGRAIDEGRLVVEVHDLRSWTTDAHRSVDDAPYGGGPGMLMSPEPWGRALDRVLGLQPRHAETVLVLPTPSGRRFSQSDAQDLALAGHGVLACGRYEGIDARVAQHYRDHVGVRVWEVSLCDAVLAGGEVAALAFIEAVARLLPGVVGNEASTREDSFAPQLGGLLEGPAYTRPETWRGLAVPEVLRSGDHAAIARWRHERSWERTRAMRPDLLTGPVSPSPPP